MHTMLHQDFKENYGHSRSSLVVIYLLKVTFFMAMDAKTSYDQTLPLHIYLKILIQKLREIL